MTTGEHDRARDALGDYWDALNQGLLSKAPAYLDSDLANIIRRVRTLDDARSPDPDFVTRLEQQIMGSSETTWFDPSAPHDILNGSPNGRREGLLMPLTMPRVDRPGRQWLAPLTTAALVLLTLISGYVAIGGPLRSGRLGEQLAMLPALIISDERPLAFMSEITGGADPLEHPSGVAVAADGTLYVIDAARDQIRVFDANGAPMATWGERGTGPGQFGFSLDFLWGDLAFGPDGSLYVLDPNNARIQKFTAEGDFLLGWGGLGSDAGQILYPKGIGVDAKGRVYLADWGNHRVQVFDGDGAFLAAWDGTQGGGAPLAGPADVTIDAAGTAWVSDEILQRMIGFAPDGTIVSTIGQIGDDPGEVRGPWGAAVDASGNLYVAEYDGDRVQVFAPDGTSLGIVGDSGPDAGQFDYPIYLTLAPDGSLYVTDEGNDRVQRFAALSTETAEAPEAQTAEVTIAPLLDLVIPTIGDEQAWLQMDRYVFPPDTTLRADMRGGAVPAVFYVADGALEIRAIEAPQPARVIRPGGAEAEEAVASGDMVKLAAGDAVIVPEGGAVDLRNLATEPATALNLMQPIDASHPTNPGVAYQTLVGRIRKVSAPLTLSLAQATLAPQAVLPSTDAPAVEQLVAPLDPDRETDARDGWNGALRNVGNVPLETYVLTVTSGVPGS